MPQLKKLLELFLRSSERGRLDIKKERKRREREEKEEREKPETNDQ